MRHYVAIVEDAGRHPAVGVWFPDLPGCLSGGDDVDEAMRNAEEALALYADSRRKEGLALPSPRSLTDIRKDPDVADDLRGHMVALVAMPEIAEAAD